MKIRKNSEVGNFEINRWYVTDKEVLELLNNGTCVELNCCDVDWYLYYSCGY